jgi:hypothetical protein
MMLMMVPAILMVGTGPGPGPAALARIASIIVVVAAVQEHLVKDVLGNQLGPGRADVLVLEGRADSERRRPRNSQGDGPDRTRWGGHSQRRHSWKRPERRRSSSNCSTRVHLLLLFAQGRPHPLAGLGVKVFGAGILGAGVPIEHFHGIGRRNRRGRRRERQQRRRRSEVLVRVAALVRLKNMRI